MKKVIFLVLITFLSCSEKKDYSEIRISNSETDFVEIKYPKADVFSMVEIDTIYPNKQKEFLFRRQISEPKYAVIKVGSTYINTMLIPGNEIQLIYKDSTYNFNGKNKAALEFFDELERPPYINTGLYKDFLTAAQIEEQILKEKTSELNALQALDSLNNIDGKLLEPLTDEINYFYAYKTLKIVLSKDSQRLEENQNLKKLYQKTLEKYPLATKYKPSSWSDYAEMILIERPLNELKNQNGLTQDSLINWRLNGDYYPKIYNVIMNYPDAKISEKVVVDQILKAQKIDPYDKSLVGVFESFKKDFPNSRYNSIIEPGVDNIKKYYEKVALGIPEGVEFLNGGEIDNLNDLKMHLKGNKYFIDIWATWCAPCLKEFKYNPQLDSVLLANGYKKLYLSVDDPDRESKWIESIKYFDLTGLNMMANKKLHSDLINNYSVQSIPKYFILDKNGEIITNDAPKPSKLKELAEVLVQ